MAIEVRTFDLYNTTQYWEGYVVPGYEIEQEVSQSFYATKFSFNPIGSVIDFFQTIPNTQLEYLWKKYWWDEAMYYSHPVALSAVKASDPDYYQDFSESVGTLYWLSRQNNLNNTATKPYSPVISALIKPEVVADVDAFYLIANALFVSNVEYIGPGTGTDTLPGSAGNSNLIMADTDLTRRITSNLSLTAAVNELYPDIYEFLPFNTTVIGNLFTPYYWSLSAYNETQLIYVDFTNTNINSIKQLTTADLVAT